MSISQLNLVWIHNKYIYYNKIYRVKKLSKNKLLPTCSKQILSACFIYVSLTIFVNAVELNKCTEIADDIQRLECFDRENKEQLEKKSSTDKESEKPHEEVQLLKPASRWQFFTERETFKITPHNANYLIPISYTDSPNNEANPDSSQENTEVKFQLSGKLKIADNMIGNNADLWAGYTQKVFWQLYDIDESSPFRETNYKPEFWVSFETNFNLLGLTNRFIDFGYVHESNGRSEPLSRSWDRLYLQFGLERGDFGLTFQPWYRFPEDPESDDNPDIVDFVGRAEFTAYYRIKNQILLAVYRTNFDLDTSGGSIELNWAFPIYKGLRGLVQYHNGYGESLIDYNVKIQRIGLGIVLTEWI